jgi:CBS domain-containing protein
MGEHQVEPDISGEQLRLFTKSLLNDLRALETMLEDGMIESGVRRIGAEQEIFLVDDSWRPAGLALEVLEELDDPHFTTELGKFNLEVNLDPQAFGGDCLSRLESQLNELLTKARDAAHRCGGEILLTGILPTLRKSDLGLDNMTPNPRYFALNRALNRLRGGAYEFRIKGVDEILIKHDSVMLEACNTSFQVHFQVGAEEFANLYNVAQAVTGPVIAVATNSPLLFGRRLWRETRIALFQQAVDTRSSSHHLRDRSPRVSFGRSWVKRSVTELFKEDIARFKILLGTELDEDPFAKLAKGEPPELKALRLHNGTVYRWNRACYGLTDGRPHLRIENRVLPSGPTPLDEVANAAFWYGLISALSHEYIDITRVMEFEDAAANFMAASRLGLSAELTWLEGKTSPAGELVLKSLLPLAREGLARRDIVSADIDRYLGVIEERVDSKMTGSQWLLTSLAGMKDHGTAGERLSALTAATVNRQKEGKPIASWRPARLEEAGGWKQHYVKVEQFMTTDLFTVHEDEPIDLVASLMDWERIRHVPVEDHESRLVGLITYRALIHLMAADQQERYGAPVPVGEIMNKDPITVSPETSSLEAMELMRSRRIGCLPVVKDGRLVGIVTERDFMDIAGELLEEKLKE